MEYNRYICLLQSSFCYYPSSLLDSCWPSSWGFSFRYHDFKFLIFSLILIVLSIGTLITEWESGSDICKTIFDNQGAVDVLVDKLSSITVHYNFDGWLINIENPIAPDKIANVIYFLRKLKLEMLQRGKATAQVIWYDSITKSGELKWQNELNEENRLVNTQLL